MRVVVFYQQSMGERCSSIRCRLVDPQKRRPSSGAVSLATLKLYTRAVLPLAILVLRATVSGSDVPSPDMISTVHRAADDWCYLLVPLRIGAQSRSTSVGT